jgi:hypothetical protein
MGLLSSKSWGSDRDSQRGWKSSKDAQKAADKKNGKHQSEFARRKAGKQLPKRREA